MNNKPLLKIIVLALAAVLVWLIFFWQPNDTAARSGQFSAQPSEPLGGDFTLYGSKGTVSLSDFRGKVIVLYFGYTYCPDVCPTSLSRIAQGFSSLSTDELQKVQGIFVSVDPERDTPQRLEEYAPFFHSSLIGVTGTAEQVATVANRYGATYRKHPQDTDGHYSVDHTSITYIIGPDGKLAVRLPYDSTPKQIVDTIRSLLANATIQ